MKGGAMMTNEIIKGFKVFNPDWTCRDFQYQVGHTYEMDEEPDVCNRGFHFCEKASDCFEYYDFRSENKVAEIEALGAVDSDGKKSCTNKIRIVREIPWDEVLRIVNEGKDCTGRCNTGDCNTGNRNTGDCNTGNRNTGDCNTGNRNTGDCNTGDWNTGNRNTGDCNTGNRN
ncbi:MAG: pentapeptide repeat-containing protein, partial [Lachnospiraceae bacterium]|nr:pentapeptide repeat-containing protein [Lachnospiraceae bacterium]